MTHRWLKAKHDAPVALFRSFPARLVPVENCVNPKFIKIATQHLCPMQAAEIAEFFLIARLTDSLIWLIQGQGLFFPAEWFELPSDEEYRFANLCEHLGCKDI